MNKPCVILALVVFAIYGVSRSAEAAPPLYSFPAIQADALGERLQSSMIWAEPEANDSSVAVAFRKTIQLVGRPDRAEFSIFADARYILWVNGRYIERGPARFQLPCTNGLSATTLHHRPGRHGRRTGTALSSGRAENRTGWQAGTGNSSRRSPTIGFAFRPSFWATLAPTPRRRASSSSLWCLETASTRSPRASGPCASPGARVVSTRSGCARPESVVRRKLLSPETVASHSTTLWSRLGGAAVKILLLATGMADYSAS
jgi:hypothetical protein